MEEGKSEDHEAPADEQQALRIEMTSEEVNALKVSQRIQEKIEKEVIDSHSSSVVEQTRIGFVQAWLLPNVILYAGTYFLAKMALQVVYYSLFEFLESIGLGQ